MAAAIWGILIVSLYIILESLRKHLVYQAYEGFQLYDPSVQWPKDVLASKRPKILPFNNLTKENTRAQKRTLEQSKARRKKRRYMKRLAAKKDVPPTIAAVSYGHQSHSKKLEEENANYKLVCYKKYKEKYMGEVDEMLMESMKKKSQERMKASEEYVDSDNGSDNNEPINEVDKSTRTDCKKCEVNNAYIKLVKRSLSEIENNCSSSLLLPAIVQPSEQITVHVQSGNNEVEKVAVEECIKNLVGERDAAMKTVRYLRNQVEDLQSRNRKIYCEMNDKIDTVRNFWRNRLVEGDTRSGMCVKLAIQRNVS